MVKERGGDDNGNDGPALPARTHRVRRTRSQDGGDDNGDIFARNGRISLHPERAADCAKRFNGRAGWRCLLARLLSREMLRHGGLLLRS